MFVPMMTVSALEKQSDTVPPRVSNKVAMTLLRKDKKRYGQKGNKIKNETGSDKGIKIKGEKRRKNVQIHEACR